MTNEETITEAARLLASAAPACTLEILSDGMVLVGVRSTGTPPIYRCGIARNPVTAMQDAIERLDDAVTEAMEIDLARREVAARRAA